MFKAIVMHLLGDVGKFTLYLQLSVLNCKMGMTIPIRKHMGKTFVNTSVVTNVLLTQKLAEKKNNSQEGFQKQTEQWMPTWQLEGLFTFKYV